MGLLLALAGVAILSNIFVAGDISGLLVIFNGSFMLTVRMTPVCRFDFSKTAGFDDNLPDPLLCVLFKRQDRLYALQRMNKGGIRVGKGSEPVFGIDRKQGSTHSDLTEI